MIKKCILHVLDIKLRVMTIKSRNSFFISLLISHVQVKNIIKKNYGRFELLFFFQIKFEKFSDLFKNQKYFVQKMFKMHHNEFS